MYTVPRRAEFRLEDNSRQYQKRARLIAERLSEGLRMIQPTPLQERFLASKAKQRVGQGGNRSGKSESLAIEVARAVTNQDPHNKFPKQGEGLIVALDWQPHIAEMWRKLTREGEFQMIPDEHTGRLRTVRPDPDDPTRLDPYDDAYREKWKDGAPLIPSRMIVRVNMESISPPTPRWAKFSTGWEFDFRSSRGAPVHGKHYNFVGFDEQLLNEQFYYEAMRGLVAINEPPEHTPRFCWTATAQVTNPQYFELCERSEMGDPNVDSFLFLVKDFPFITAAEKKAFHDSLPEDERATRYHGIQALAAQRIYPSFDTAGPHGCEPFEIPPDWCRVAAVDPGRSYCATILAAIPPDQTHTYIYDGFVLRNKGAIAWAAEMAQRQRGVRFESIVIDQRAGEQHGMGSEDNEGVAHKYWDALMTAGVQPKQQGSIHKWGGFFPGTTDVRAREEALKTWMVIRSAGPGAGSAKLQVFRGTIPELEKQMRYACMDRDDPTKRQKRKSRPDDLLAALEYLAHFDPGYHIPESLVPSPVKDRATVLDAWKDQQRYERAQQRYSRVPLYA